MTKTALILIDIQNDYFEGGLWLVDKMQQAANNAKRLLDNARRNDDMIFHIYHEIPSDEAPFFRPGTHGAKIHDCVAPKGQEKLILKHRPNSFHNTSLRQDLEAAGITDVVICGAMSQMCIDATARAAADFGYAVTVVADACGAKEQAFNDQVVPAEQVHAAFMGSLALTYAQVVLVDAYLSESARSIS